MQKFGIDVSHWQGNFDFKNAKEKEGVEFAILKIGGGDSGLYHDSQFENNYKKCEECGLDKGAYFFGHAMSMEEAKEEAQHFIKLLQGKKFEYPVFYDVEDEMLNVGKELLTNIIIYVLDELEKADYWAGLYGSSDNISYYADDTKLTKYSHWMARYHAEKPTMKSGAEVQMWQFGGSTNYLRDCRINGIVVDQNYCYVDYPSIIKAKGLNGYTAEKNEAAQKAEEPKRNSATTEKIQKTTVAQQGEGYYQIAQRMGMTAKWQEIQKLNGNKVLYPGDTVILPDDVTTEKTETKQNTMTVLKGEGYYQIAQRMGMTAKWQEIQKLNGNKPLYEGDTVILP